MKIKFEVGKLLFNGGKVIRLYEPPAGPSDWLYIGTTGTHNSVLTFNYTGGGCPTLSEIDFHLTVNEPPANYSAGHVFRVTSFDAIDFFGCGVTYWQAVL
jgi:hypothetical protein